MPRRKPKPKIRNRTSAPKTCGDFGGVSADTGEPCKRFAGTGTDKRSGPCVYHTPEALARIAEQKELFLGHFHRGTVSMQAACAEIGTTPATVMNWRHADPDFAEDYERAQSRSDDVRVSFVEDGLFARSIAGNAHPAETIFFLKNRGKGRWRDKVEVTGADGKDLIPLSLIREIIREDDAEREAGR